jgi:PAS domain S-box-containing protein
VKKRESVGLGLALAILCVVAVLTYRSIDGASETLGWMEHTSQVLRQLDEVNATYARSASARRAYVVAGDSSQLPDVAAQDERLTRTIAAVRDLLSDNPTQVRRLDLLKQLYGQRISDLESSVERRRLAGAASETAEGLALTARIRTVREEMVGEENRLLAERHAQTERDVSRTKVADVVGTAASLAILLYVFRRLRQAEDSHQRANRFLDSIVENIPNMIFVKEAGELRFERFNRAGEELLGVERKDLIGKNDHDMFPRDQAEAFQRRDRETLAAGTIVDIAEEPIQTKAGERWLHTKKVPVLDEDGAPKYLLGISEDITERRATAAALRAAKDVAEAANQELEAFSYSVAHDLRAPLRAIDGFGLALAEDCAGKLDPESADHLKRIRASAQHMGQLIDGLLGLSKVTRGDLVREKVDMTKIARGSGARLRDANPHREVELVIREGLVAEGDARLVAAAFDNLLSNAWKFTSKCTQARVEVGRLEEDKEEKTVFFVGDNGVGFDPTYAHKLFGAFQRLHGASEFEGSGIGLATVQRIVRRHGGRIWADGKVGQGATFYFTF